MLSRAEVFDLVGLTSSMNSVPSVPSVADVRRGGWLPRSLYTRRSAGTECVCVEAKRGW